MSSLTKSQTEFVKNVNKNLLVSASAGCGKTFTMVTKIINLLKNGLDLDNLLIITYSNAAGAELKTKIAEEIIKELQVENNPFVEHFSNQLEKIGVSNIGTIHSFCKNLITKYFYKLEISPTFKVLSGSEWDYLFDEAIENVLLEYSNNKDENFYNVYEHFSDKRNNKKLKTVIKTIYNFMVASEDVNNWFNTVCKQQFNTNLNTNMSAVYLFNLMQQTFKDLHKTFLNFKLKLQQLQINKYDSFINSYLSFLMDATNCSDFESFVKVMFKPYEFDKKPRVTKDMPPEIYDLDGSISEYRLELSDTIKKYKEILISDDLEEHKNSIINLENLVVKLYEIVSNVLKEFRTLKSDRTYIDFNDMEQYCLTILKDEDIRKEISDKFEYIFIDEYQDVSYVQEEIVKNISKPNNLNMIGDVKQSIYAFRLCSPEIFIDKYDKFKNDNKLGLALDLNENFRSENSILQFSNFIFNTLATENTIGINYSKNAQLECGNNNFKNISNKNCNNPKVVILNSEGLTEDEPIKQEAIFVANEIKDLLTKKYINSKTGTLDFYKYKDIAVLMRDASGYANTYYSVFKELGIPVNLKLKTNVFKTVEVQTIYSFLKLVNNFNDDVSLAVVLLSPICNLKESDLIEIRKLDLQKPFNKIVFNFNNYNLTTKKQENIKNVIQNLFKEIENFKIELSLNNLQTCVKNFVFNHDLINYFKADKNGSESETNITTFISMLGQENYKFSLNKFLEYARKFENENDNEIKIANNSNSVTICTMHTSKGLEWPAVIVVGAGKKFNENILKEDVVVSREFGIGTKVLKNKKTRTKIKTLALSACIKHTQLKEHKENIRLFYVALTRAKNSLTVVASTSVKNVKAKNNKNALAFNTFLDYLLLPLSASQINKLVVENNLNISFNNEQFVYELKEFDNAEDLHKTKENAVLPQVCDKISKQIVTNINIKNNIKQNNVAIKNTVTGVLTEENDYENLQLNVLDFKVNFDESLVKNKSVSIGNAYHKVLQKVDYFKDNNLFEIVENLAKFDVDVMQNIDNININLLESCVKNIRTLINKDSKIFKEAQFLLSDNHNNLIEKSDIKTKVIVQGVVDLIIINNDEACIIDFKTNKNTNSEYLLNTYKTQINLYAKACEKAFNVKVTKKLIYSIMGEKFIVVK